ncbi:hypothetical protein OG455_33080 [Kitasatospora sp. NBC_01287]|uniref:hypothetical protein n=1 Tax=Kitasatospora sp. NBC_01287 TaxID=2903573 RepID=UPI0022542971|nr:hypothetical protein [Kitasatospora sp. NBC_01287]MCX4750291.1 hypothetical protein [Kitasatospora sp. NBC_01287]
MVEVGSEGAFGVNSIGLGRSVFPLSFSVREAGGSWLVNTAPVQTRELVDVLTRSANDAIVVVDLATVSFLDEEYQQWPPSRIAAAQGVDCAAHPLGAWAAGTIGLGTELLVLDRRSLPRFLADWSPYELSLVDLPTGAEAGAEAGARAGAAAAGVEPDAARLDELALVVGTAVYPEPLLPRLPGSRLYYSGHDDCYAAIESLDPALPAAVLGRMLALLAGPALTGPDQAAPARVPEPDRALPEQLIRESPHWVGVLGPVTGTTVTVDLSARPHPWRLDHHLPTRVDRVASLDLVGGGWRLAPAGAPRA